jgi:membrane protein DedA with SNARE-associated domain
MEEALVRIVSIYLVGITGIWKSIPLGIMLESHPLEIAILTSLGSITAVFILFFLGDYVKVRTLKKWNPEKLEKRTNSFSKIMDKYGTAGIGIICPGLFGPITCIIVGLLVVPKTSRLMPFLTIGIVLWSFALTYLATSGIDLIKYWT